MTRWLVGLCVVVILLAVPLGAFCLEKIPTAEAAETAVPMYGCGGSPFVTYYNGNPIGGGTGYGPTYSASDADYVVSTAAQLKSALASASSGDIVYVKDGATITLDSTSNWYAAGTGFYVRAGVTLSGGRGRTSSPGTIRLGSGFYNANEYALIRLSASSKLRGLHIDGPQDGTTGGNRWSGVRVTGNGAEIANCEIHGFGSRGVRIEFCTGVLVHYNHIHHIRQSDAAMIVVQGSKFSEGNHASAIVEGNYFDYGVQGVAAARCLASYTARYNYFGSNWIGKIFDAHGQNDNDGAYLQKTAGGAYEWPAGEYIKVHNNTSMSTSHGFLRFRGTPTSYGFHSVHNNWTCEKKTTLYSGSGGSWAPICQQLWYIPEYGYNPPRDSAGEPWGYHPWVRMEEYDNWWGTTAPPASTSTNSAPLTPAAPQGTTSGQTSTSYTYSVKTTDPDGDSIAYTIDWGDATTFTSGLTSSGTSVSATHSWAKAGTYSVKVRGTDSKGNSSSWSPSLTVQIAAFAPSIVPNNAPTVPVTPSGVTGVLTSFAYLYSAVATDPDGDALSYTFNWGDGTSTTVPEVDSGTTAYAWHAWTQPGTYPVRVSATDSKGSVSDWSDAFVVTVVASAAEGSSGTGDADFDGAATGPATGEEGEHGGPSNPAVDDADNDSPPLSPDHQSPVGVHGPGLILWLMALVVMVGAAVFLTGAIVRECVPKPPRWYSDLRDRRD